MRALILLCAVLVSTACERQPTATERAIADLRAATDAHQEAVIESLKGEPLLSAEYLRCKERGIAFFKDTDQYPRLRDGSLAEDEAAERCRRNRFAIFL